MAVFTLVQYFREQWRTLPQPRAVDAIHSKAFLVTGSNVGLGFEASVHLAKMRPKLLIATSRDPIKCTQARESILNRVDASGIPSAEVDAWPLELGSFQSVCAFADKLATDGNRTLNGFIANAGMFSNRYAQTQDGWEETLQVNYLSTALLSILLLPHLINSSSPDSLSRLVVVSSFVHYLVPMSETESWDNILETINRPEFGDSVLRYQVSKCGCYYIMHLFDSQGKVDLQSLPVLGVIFIRELASRLPESTSVVACAVDPGYCVSNIVRNRPERWAMYLLRRFFLVRSTEKGSRTLVHAAVSSDVSMHGRYLMSCEVAEECDFILSPEGKAFSARVWDETIQLLSGVDGRVSEIVEKWLRVDS